MKKTGKLVAASFAITTVLVFAGCRSVVRLERSPDDGAGGTGGADVTSGSGVGGMDNSTTSSSSGGIANFCPCVNMGLNGPEYPDDCWVTEEEMKALCAGMEDPFETDVSCHNFVASGDDGYKGIGIRCGNNAVIDEYFGGEEYECVVFKEAEPHLACP